MKPIHFLFFCLLCISLVIGGCFGSDEEPTPTPAPPPPTATLAATVAPTPTTVPATPAAKTAAPVSPLAAPVSPLAAPVSPVALPAASPEQKVITTTKTGSVVGSVVVKSPTVDKAVVDVIVALAEVIKRTDGPPRATGYDPAHSPQTAFDHQGHFVINNVPPGDYGIIVDWGKSAFMLNDPKTGNGIVITVKANAVTDIGTLTYQSLPMPDYK